MKKAKKRPPSRRIPVGWITRSEAARRRGVGPSAVSNACRLGGALHGAVRGRFLDSNSTSFVAWMAAPRDAAELHDLAVRKRSAEIMRLEIRNAKERGELISRELVRTHVFGSIESTNKRLLYDSPKTIARAVYALARNGAPIEEAERAVRDHLSSQLSAVKTTAVRLLRGNGEQEASP